MNVARSSRLSRTQRPRSFECTEDRRFERATLFISRDWKRFTQLSAIMDHLSSRNLLCHPRPRPGLLNTSGTRAECPSPAVGMTIAGASRYRRPSTKSKKSKGNGKRNAVRVEDQLDVLILFPRCQQPVQTGRSPERLKLPLPQRLIFELGHPCVPSGLISILGGPGVGLIEVEGDHLLGRER